MFAMFSLRIDCPLSGPNPSYRCCITIRGALQTSSASMPSAVAHPTILRKYKSDTIASIEQNGRPQTYFFGLKFIGKWYVLTTGKNNEAGLVFQHLDYLVGARGFEPPTTWPPAKYATRLRYAPNWEL